MATQVFSDIIILFLGGWFLFSVLNQHKRWKKSIRFFLNYDICSLIPIWTFFAPNPGRTDIYLLYRDRDEEGSISDWREIKTSFRNAWFAQWSPLRRIQKGIVDVAYTLHAEKITESRQSISKRNVVGFPYLLLLHYVCTKPFDFSARARQFAIARTNGHGTEDETDVIFLSAFHQLPHPN